MMNFADVQEALTDIRRTREMIAGTDNPPLQWREWDKQLERLEKAYEVELEKAAARSGDNPDEWWARRIFGRFMR